jgi:acetoin utilization deacetylase AcuC-like enzyme
MGGDQPPASLRTAVRHDSDRRVADLFRESLWLTAQLARQERGLAQRCGWIEARPARENELTSVHTADYVQRICSLRDQVSWVAIPETVSWWDTQCSVCFMRGTLSTG